MLASARASSRAVCLPPGNWGSSEMLEAKEYKPTMNVMDTQAMKYIKKFSLKKVANYNSWNHTTIV